MKKLWVLAIGFLLISCAKPIYYELPEAPGFRMGDKDQLTALASQDKLLVEDYSDASNTKYTTIDDINTYLGSIYQPLTAYLTDLGDGNITSNFVNETYPWADNEMADNHTMGSGGTIHLTPIQTACTSDFHNIGGTDDDVPDAGDFGAGTDLDSNGAVAWGNLAEGELADSSIISADIKDNTIDSADYAAGSVDDEHLASGINATKIADGSVDNAEFQRIDGITDTGQTLISDGNITAQRATLGCGTAATRDADQDLESSDDVTFNKVTVIEELSIGASANPLIRFRDSDSSGTDKFTGNINMPYVRGTDGNETAWIYFRCMEDGSNTTQMYYDGNESTWVVPTGKKFVALGTLMGGQSTESKSGNYTVGTVNQYESYGTIFVDSDNDTEIFTLESAADGMSVCFMNGIGVSTALYVRAGTGDYIVLGGVRTSAGGDISSAGALGDSCCLITFDATDWHVLGPSGTWGIP